VKEVFFFLCLRQQDNKISTPVLGFIINLVISTKEESVVFEA
jgi:hypothetical protein